MRNRSILNDGSFAQDTEKTQSQNRGRRHNHNGRVRGIRISVDYEVEVSKDGKILSRCKGKDDAFVKLYLRALKAIWKGDGTTTVPSESLLDRGGTSRTFYGGHGSNYICNIMGMTAPANNSNFGVIIGSSDIAFSKDHYNLQSVIAHGSGSGQLLYGADTLEDLVDEDSTTRIRLIRGFTNSSGAVVTVKEIGIAFVQYNYTATTYYYFLACRDVLTSPQSVPDGATLTVRYRIYISYA